MGYSNRTWTCPFFTWDERQKVHCEGGCLSMPKDAFAEYTEQYCASVTGWRDCPKARALMRHYERTENDAKR